MKVVAFSVKNKNKKTSKKLKFNIEKVLFFSFILVFAALIMAQAALTSPSLRTYLVTDSRFDGSPLGTEETLYAQGKVGIELTRGDSTPDLKVLLNGEEVNSFTTKHLDLTVRNGDVIEIDDSIANKEFEVSIVSISSNIKQSGLNRTIDISRGIKRLTVVRLTDKNT